MLPRGDSKHPLPGPQFCASRAYESNRADELSVPAGARVRVLEKSDRGWWLCRYASGRGRGRLAEAGGALTTPRPSQVWRPGGPPPRGAVATGRAGRTPERNGIPWRRRPGR